MIFKKSFILEKLRSQRNLLPIQLVICTLFEKDYRENAKESNKRKEPFAVEGHSLSICIFAKLFILISIFK